MYNVNFSIITVCFNSIENIELTIKSVLSQKKSNYEYIIIDGGSNDGTIEVIKKYAENNKSIKFITEKDEGIYDAMNKGIKMASNDLVYFLNSGDTFCNDNVLNKVSQNYNGEDIIYGNIVIDGIVNKSNEKLNKLLLIRDKMICHQAIFSKRDTFKHTGLFDIKYRFCGDRKWLMKAVKKNLTCRHIDIEVCNYDNNGISSDNKNMVSLYKENGRIIKEEFGILVYSMVYIKRKIGNLRRDIKL